jgi:O-6-methylguanine DNA methyltransferase
VGIDAPWPTKLKSPAYKNMSKPQLRCSIELGRRILEGEEDLVELDGMSLALRGKDKTGTKRKREEEAHLKSSKRIREASPALKVEEIQSDHTATPSPDEKSRFFKRSLPPSKGSNADLKPFLSKIALSHKTPFQKKVLSLLCQIPPGRYTTYAAISKHLSSSPRAVGNSIRNNPFAPMVPCHRVLASGGGIGGFHGSWGRNGEKGLNDDKKRALLRDEGVRFDGVGKVVGQVWEGFR